MSDTYNFENTTNFKTVKIIPLKGEKGDAGDSGDYAALTNKPSINGVTMNGNQTTADLGIASSASVSTVAENVYTKAEVIPVVIDLVYPVGSVYLSVNSANPSTLFPNTTWEQIKGKFLLGSDDTQIWGRDKYVVGDTGGEETHALSVTEIPSHHHDIGLPVGETAFATTGQGNEYWRVTSGSYRYTTENKGGGMAHNNMPPYLVVSIWKRTA